MNYRPLYLLSYPRNSLQLCIERLISIILLLGVVFYPSSSFGEPLDYKAAPVDNPLKGLVPYPDRAAENRFPHSVEFDYISLKDILDVDGNGNYKFNWSSVENFLNSAKARGNQGVFRIFSEYPGRANSIPQFLIDRGLTVTELAYGNQTAWTPDYGNIDFINALKATVAALGAEYDGDERIAYLELGLLGIWGEWHNFGQEGVEPNSSVRGEILDAYGAAFSTTKLLARYPRGLDEGDRSNINHAVGYHDDSFAWNTLGTASWKFMQLTREANALTKWETEVIGGELFPDLNKCVFEEVCEHEGTAASDFIETVKVTHASYMRVGEVFKGGIAQDRITRAKAAVKRMGYDLYFSEATISPAANGITISAKLENRGVAPFYYNWPVTVGLLDVSGNTLQEWSVDWRIDTLLPDVDRVFSGVFTPDSPVPVGAQIALRVPNPMDGGRPVRFSNFNQQVDGEAWMILGGADGTAPPSAPEKVLFIRGGLGTVGFFEGGSDEQGADVFNYTTNAGNHGWGELNAALVAEGFQVEQLSEDPVLEGIPTPVPLDIMDLAQYSVIVFGSNNAEYTGVQVDAFIDYIQNGGAALFVSDANFGQNWGDAPSSDQHFLDRFGLTMNQDTGTYSVRRSNEFVTAAHPILDGVDEFDGEGVSPITRGTPPDGVTSTLVTLARFNVRQNTGSGQGPTEPAATDDGSLVIANYGSGRIAGHFDRNTFFNENGAGTNINRFDNEVYARNLFNWLAGNPTATDNYAPRGHFPTLLPETGQLEGVGFSTNVIAKDPDGSVVSVALQVDGSVIATDTSVPYEFDIPGLTGGVRIITARITDDDGMVTDVDLVINVIDGVDTQQPLDRTTWILSSNRNTDSLGNAIDGDVSTRWSTQEVQGLGQKFSIDFGQRKIFERIVLETPDDPNDFPRGYIVRGSNDGIAFNVLVSGVGAGATTEISLTDPVTYRYVEIEQTGSSPSNWWSIGEINIFAPPLNGVLPLGSWLQFHFQDSSVSLLEDSDGDGLTNLEEYAFNTDPFENSSFVRPVGVIGSDPNGQTNYIDYTFRRLNDEVESDVSYLIETSTNLVNWNSPEEGLEFPFDSIYNGDGTETVTSRIRFASGDLHQFVRLRLEDLR